MNDDDLKITVHDTTPKAGMRHSGLYPKIVEVEHLPTGTRVLVGSESTQMANLRKAKAGLTAVLATH